MILSYKLVLWTRILADSSCYVVGHKYWELNNRLRFYYFMLEVVLSPSNVPLCVLQASPSVSTLYSDSYNGHIQVLSFICRCRLLSKLYTLLELCTQMWVAYTDTSPTLVLLYWIYNTHAVVPNTTTANYKRRKHAGEEELSMYASFYCVMYSCMTLTSRLFYMAVMELVPFT